MGSLFIGLNQKLTLYSYFCKKEYESTGFWTLVAAGFSPRRLKKQKIPRKLKLAATEEKQIQKSLTTRRLCF